MIHIITIGKKHEGWVSNGIDLYDKRLKQPYDTRWTLLPHSSYDGDKACSDESNRIIEKLKPESYVVLLDETGKQYTSPNIAELCEWQFSHGRPMTYIIGGAYGVSQNLLNRVDATWSLSKLVFPHQLVRLILVEQLYRAQEIARGGSYHHS